MSLSLKSLVLAAGLCAAVLAPLAANAGSYVYAFNPGTYYFGGSCTDCSPDPSPASAKLVISNPYGGAQFSYSSALYPNLQSLAVYSIDGATPGASNSAQFAFIDFFAESSRFSFTSNGSGSWMLSRYGSLDEGFGGTWSTTPPPAAVPEPQSWALMLGGLALAGAVARRRLRA